MVGGQRPPGLHTGVPEQPQGSAKLTIHERNIKSQLKSKNGIATVYRSAHKPASNYPHSTEQLINN